MYLGNILGLVNWFGKQNIVLKTFDHAIYLLLGDWFTSFIKNGFNLLSFARQYTKPLKIDMLTLTKSKQINIFTPKNLTYFQGN